MAEIICKCGARIFGSSEDHAKGNLKIHEISKRHKLLVRKNQEKIKNSDQIKKEKNKEKN